MQQEITERVAQAGSRNDKTYQFNRIELFLNGKKQHHDIPPGISTLHFLHRELGLFGTKCSCNEGDCGTCTVVVCYPQGDEIIYKAINSCLYPAAKLHGKHLLTIEGLGNPEVLHPIQKALLDYHGTQCGYCTPGFVMSLFALLASNQHPDRERILACLEGNLCRCTGYVSILEAAEYLSANFDISAILPSWCRTIEVELKEAKTKPEHIIKITSVNYMCERYFLPQNLAELFAIMQQNPDHKIICGGTDIMVQVNIQRKKYPCLIDISELEDVPSINASDTHLTIGAKVTYSELLESTLVATHLPALQRVIRSIASEQIRNFATLCGNVGNASPIGDTLPILLVLDAVLWLVSASGERRIPMNEYFLDYKQTKLAPDEIIKSIEIPLPSLDTYIDFSKAAKRKSVDISSISSAIFILMKNNQIEDIHLALGGVAKTPVLVPGLASFVTGKPISALKDFADNVAQEYSPISDVRGSSSYRRRMIKNHLLIYKDRIEQATVEVER